MQRLPGTPWKTFFCFSSSGVLLESQSRKQFGRQHSKNRLVLAHRLKECHAVVIGAGAIGRSVAILLASSGVKYMSMYDPAFVIRKDLARGFMEDDLGLAKVDAVANITHQHNPRMELLAYRCRFRRAHLQNWRPSQRNAVFLCFDSQGVRKSIWNEGQQSAQFICHARFCSDVLRLDISPKPAIDECYTSRLVSVDSKSCSSDLVMAHFVASLMVMQFKRWLWAKPSSSTPGSGH